MYSPNPALSSPIVNTPTSSSFTGSSNSGGAGYHGVTPDTSNNRVSFQ
jgi:hypothetical protein